MKLAAGGAVAALGLGGLGVGIAEGHGGHRAHWITVSDTWFLQNLPEHDHAIDAAGMPVTNDDPDFIPGPGGEFFFTENIFAATPEGTRGERIGTDYGDCEVTNTAGICTVHVEIHDRGTITVHFGFGFGGVDTVQPQPDGVSAQGHELPEETPPQVVTIVGGSGEFKGIQGEATLYHDTGEDDIARLELDAVMPRTHHD